MSDSPGAMQTAAGITTAIKEAIGKLLPSSEVPDPQKPTEAESQAAWARKKYDTLIRWILGTFGAIGLLIFGSVPFTNLTDVDFWPGGVLGLAIVGLGLSVVVWASTIGFEPQDASLGELSESIKTAAKAKCFLWWRPRARANQNLAEVLSGIEGEAHLGPGIRSVDQLILRIGQLERDLLKAGVAWDGGDAVEPVLLAATPGPPSTPPASGGGGWATSSASLSEIASVARLQLDESAIAMTALLSYHKDSPADSTEGFAGAISSECVRQSELRELLPSADNVRASGEVAAIKQSLNLYLSHRELLLQESAIAQLRGTFRFVRGFLFLGALLTLSGGIFYTYVLSNPTDDALNVPVLVSLSADTGAWTSAAACRSDDTADAVDLEAILVSSENRDGLENGPFEAILTETNCQGVVITVTDKGGSYRPLPPAEEPAVDASSADTAARPPLVSVSIKQNSAAWKVVNECAGGSLAGDIEDLSSLLREVLEDDANGDGPFVIETVDPRCSGLVVTVDDGDGSFTKIN